MCVCVDLRQHTCQRTIDLLQDLLSQQVDQPGDHLPTTTSTVRQKTGRSLGSTCSWRRGGRQHPPEGTSS